MRAAGLSDRGRPYQATYVAAFEQDLAFSRRIVPARGALKAAEIATESLADRIETPALSRLHEG
ncbi:hypothetical protein [Sorangium sp. So ce1000]|uniref:hypothetical protein n=1 Tax=Sorangium sp. So ce1000 TaxID=3133325 RepID=UPI003F637D1F